MWGSPDSFSVEKSDEFFSFDMEFLPPLPDVKKPEDALLSVQLIEKRYDVEHQFMQAVSAGQTHKAELLLAQISSRQFELRANTVLRSLKDYGFVLNTILRIAAEAGTVHPIHLDRISSQYAKKIELTGSEAALHSLTKEMVRKYCLLVKNHSLKGYSLLVRKVITNIDADLTADLSLKTQSLLLNVNSSYLSTLFKKETGMTLTEYVNKKRIEHAILLLNSTDLQIQMIAQTCGIPDVNYFTKIYKKIVGRTPKEYRELIN